MSDSASITVVSSDDTIEIREDEAVVTSTEPVVLDVQSDEVVIDVQEVAATISDAPAIRGAKGEQGEQGTSVDFVNHGVDADRARPDINGSVLWIGSVSPNNALPQDEWLDLQGDKHYQHSQSVPAAVWTITHNLGKKPSVSIIDSGGNEWQTAVQHISENQCVIRFTSPFSGVAFLN